MTADTRNSKDDSKSSQHNAGAYGTGNNAEGGCPNPQHDSGGHVTEGDPVDVETGSVFTVLGVDFALGEPIPFILRHTYSTNPFAKARCGVQLALHEEVGCSAEDALRTRTWVWPFWIDGYRRPFFLERPPVRAETSALDLACFLGEAGASHVWEVPLGAAFCCLTQTPASRESSSWREYATKYFSHAYPCATPQFALCEPDVWPNLGEPKRIRAAVRRISRGENEGSPTFTIWFGSVCWFFVLWILISACTLPVLLSLRTWNWRETSCTIHSSGTRHRETTVRSSKVETGRAVVSYAYKVREHEYASQRYNRNDGAVDGASERVRKLTPGARVLCYYDPDEPSHAILARDGVADPLLAIVTQLYLYLGLSCFIDGLKGLEKTKPRPYLRATFWTAFAITVAASIVGFGLSIFAGAPVWAWLITSGLPFLLFFAYRIAEARNPA